MLGTYETITNEVIATDAKVTIGATTYTCHHYMQTSTAYPAILHYYLEPGLGYVQIERIRMLNVPTLMDRWQVQTRTLK